MPFLNYWSCCNRKLITVTKVSIEDYWGGLRLEKSKNEERCREEKDLSLFVESGIVFALCFLYLSSRNLMNYFDKITFALCIIFV